MFWVDGDLGKGAEFDTVKNSKWQIHSLAFTIWMVTAFLTFLFAGGFVLAENKNIKPGKTVNVTLPVLTVSQGDDGKWFGKVVELELSVTRKSDDRPLLVAIAEDRPSGVGEQFRAAMWSAASTVALERGDPLRGYKLEITAQDAIDGPSAGAMITFGVMNALDGCTMANDFVFTGCILPNGSVGYVGGLVQKIEAAKAAGKRRVFVPAYYRAEKDLNTGEMVDLKEKCRSLNLQLIPVANIRQAYALINDIKEPPNDSASLELELPDKVEDLLSTLYKRELKDSEAVYGDLTLEERDLITNTPMLKHLMLDSRDRADQAYRAGNLPAAYDDIGDRPAFIKGFGNACLYLSNLSDPNLSPKQKIETFDQEIEKHAAKRFNAMSNYLPTCAFTNCAAAQFNGFSSEVSMFSAINDYFNRVAQSVLGKAADSRDAKEQEGLLNQAYEMKLLQLMVADGWEESRSIEDYRSFAGLFAENSLVANGRHRAIEQVLFNSMESAFNAFNANMLKPAAEAQDITQDHVAANYAMADLSFLESLKLRQTSEILRQGLTKDSSLYSLISLSRSHAEALACITAQTIKNDLDPQEDESSNTRYGNTSLLNAMLQSAREEALAAIGHCQKSKIECWEPVALVQIADAKRDDPNEDKLDVFEKYFEAALDAKILTLMCGPNK